ncbi:MAG: CBS domain-containing protein [Myxococcales bacterium]|nr:CBS domain-containing protein [Myxococcales bacterium]
MIVKELMTPDPATLSPEDSVREAMDLLFSLDIRHIPIVEDDALVGMVSDRDLRDASLPALIEFEHRDTARKLLDRPIGDFMRADVLAVEPDADVVELIELMVDHKVGAVPVVDAETDELVGIVSYIDVLRACADLF